MRAIDMISESIFGYFKVLCQVAGPIETNCYLVHDPLSGAAALIDPGWEVDALMGSIKKNKLDLKYIFVTHGHIDHYYGIPTVKKQFPDAKVCMHRDDYRDIFTAVQWIRENYGQEWMDDANSNPKTKLYMDFDNHLIGVPEVFFEDNQAFVLGDLKLKTIHTPGHSPGGVCFHAGNVLFTGDVLFYRSVGRIDTQHGSREEQIKSVRKLYRMFPDSTIVFPGHGQSTNIGSEKKENKYITEQWAFLK